MSGARTPVVVRQHSPKESFQLEALKMLLKTGSKKATEDSGGSDDVRKGRDAHTTTDIIPG